MCKLINIRWTDIQPFHSPSHWIKWIFRLQHHPSEFITCNLCCLQNLPYFYHFFLDFACLCWKVDYRLTKKNMMLSAQVSKVECVKNHQVRNYKRKHSCNQVCINFSTFISLSLTYFGQLTIEHFNKEAFRSIIFSLSNCLNSLHNLKQICTEILLYYRRSVRSWVWLIKSIKWYNCAIDKIDLMQNNMLEFKLMWMRIIQLSIKSNEFFKFSILSLKWSKMEFH